MQGGRLVHKNNKERKENMELKNTNLGFNNSGKYVGDNDGPAYVVYSKIGYKKASYEFLLSQAKINMRR